MKNAPRILLVEDDEDDLFLTSRILRKSGIIDVYHVSDGRVALDYLSGVGPFANRQVHPLPDVVLVDLKIPEIDGHRVIEWLTAQPELAGVRAFVLSSSGEQRDRLRAQAGGAAGYFVKPLTSHDISVIQDEFASGSADARPGLRRRACGN